MLSSPPSTSAKSSTLDGLPKSFIHVLRTLFDILDDKKTGLVKFSDIEARWQEDGASDLPKGVIDSLRKITPPNGFLSFERFCAGLKICLLRNQMELRSKNDEHSLNTQMKHLVQRPPSAPLLEVFDSKCSINDNNQWNTCPIPSNQLSKSMRHNQLRTLSMPHLNPDGNNNKEENKDQTFQNKHCNTNVLLGPPKPPRTNISGGFFSQRSCDTIKTDKTEIRAALQNWQMGLMSDDKQITSYKNILNTRTVGENTKILSEYPESQTHKKLFIRRREPRRHTLQNGVDCNMLKKMKQIESEKEMLLEGLQAVERARDWYRKQIAAVQDKIKYVCRMGSQEQWSEAQQERIELLRARILEVNRHLATLGGNNRDNSKSNISEDRDGLPLHMNLAVHSQSRLSHMQVLSQLKRQNHILTREITHKTEKINNLEREKAALIRELYQIRRKSDQPVCKSQNVTENVSVAPPAYI